MSISRFAGVLILRGTFKSYAGLLNSKAKSNVALYQSIILDRLGSGYTGAGIVVTPPYRGSNPSQRPRPASINLFVVATILTTTHKLRQTINSLDKTEIIWHCGPWKNLDEAEYATLEWVDWFSNR